LVSKEQLPLNIFVAGICFFINGTFNRIYVPFVQDGFGFYYSNLLPLMLTAGLMGFLDIPLKPSTILVLIAFGLSVDDTVRFLSQYREEELKKITGRFANQCTPLLLMRLGMFTSIVSFFGFRYLCCFSFGVPLED
jgi:hypothetical protein